MPTLFAAGDDRGEWTPEQARAMVSTMQNAEVETLHGVRGIAPLEDAPAVVALLRNFWAAHPFA